MCDDSPCDECGLKSVKNCDECPLFDHLDAIIYGDGKAPKNIYKKFEVWEKKIIEIKKQKAKKGFHKGKKQCPECGETMNLERNKPYNYWSCDECGYMEDDQ